MGIPQPKRLARPQGDFAQDLLADTCMLPLEALPLASGINSQPVLPNSSSIEGGLDNYLRTTFTNSLTSLPTTLETRTSPGGQGIQEEQTIGAGMGANRAATNASTFMPVLTALLQERMTVVDNPS